MGIAVPNGRTVLGRRVVITIAVRRVQGLAVEVVVVAIVVAVVTIAGGGVQPTVQAVRGAVGSHSRGDAIKNAIGIAKTLLLQRRGRGIARVPTSGDIVDIPVVDMAVAVQSWSHTVAYNSKKRKPTTNRSEYSDVIFRTNKILQSYRRTK